jgi:hypothetical protein
VVQVVYVLDAVNQVAVHTLTYPAHACCACTCEAAVQRKICVDQVAWLLLEFPSGDPAHRVILGLLGTRFGFEWRLKHGEHHSSHQHGADTGC